MQQLGVDNVELHQQQIVLVNLNNVNWDTFDSFCKGFCIQFNLRLLEMNQGADRCQMRFNFQHQDFLLCYEALCDSLWIENYTHENPETIKQLCYYLKTNP